MDTITLIGVAGAGLMLIAFVGNQLGTMSAESLLYDVLNFIGGVLLVWYAVLLHSVPFMILEGIWALVAFRDVIKDLARGGKTR